MLVASVIAAFFNDRSTREVRHEPSSAIASMAVCRAGVIVHDYAAHYSVVRTEQPGSVDLWTHTAFVESASGLLVADTVFCL